MHKFKMSQTIPKLPKLTYQLNLTEEIKETFYSPTFSTNNNMFWQLSIQPEGEYYGVYLNPVADPDEIIWGERSKLSFKIIVNEVRNNQITELCSDNFDLILTDTKITYGCGCSKAFKRSSNGELIIGIIFKDIEYKESGIYKNYSIEPVPKNLLDAWKNQLFDFQVDVEFIVQDEKFYASSSMLSKRSEYFTNILADSAVVSFNDVNQIENNDTENNLENSTEMLSRLQMDNVADEENDVEIKDTTMPLNSNLIKYHIEISDCDPITFLIILKYLYTNQIKWTNNDDESITLKLFCLADKYHLFELRERAKIRIIDELNISNASEIMFSLFPKYDDLKEPVLKFMVENFAQVSSTQGFKNVLAGSADYPGFDETMSELLTEHFKIQKAM